MKCIQCKAEIKPGATNVSVYRSNDNGRGEIYLRVVDGDPASEIGKAHLCSVVCAANRLERFLLDRHVDRDGKNAVVYSACGKCGIDYDPREPHNGELCAQARAAGPR